MIRRKRKHDWTFPALLCAVGLAIPIGAAIYYGTNTTPTESPALSPSPQRVPVADAAPAKKPKAKPAQAKPAIVNTYEAKSVDTELLVRLTTELKDVRNEIEDTQDRLFVLRRRSEARVSRGMPAAERYSTSGAQALADVAQARQDRERTEALAQRLHALQRRETELEVAIAQASKP